MVPWIDVSEEPIDARIDPMVKFNQFLDEEFTERCDKIECQRVCPAKYLEVKGKVSLLGIERVNWRNANRRNRVRINTSHLNILAYVLHLRKFCLISLKLKSFELYFLFQCKAFIMLTIDRYFMNDISKFLLQ